jgi:hypothetical protein
MLKSLDSYEIQISCTHCCHKIKKSIGWIKSNSDFICVCGTRIKLDADQFKSDIERSLSDLQRTIKGLNKE